MAHVPYANVVECLMHTMVYTRPNILHTINMVSKYMTNLEKKNLECSEVDFEGIFFEL